MLSYLKSLFKPNLDPLNEITISRSAILHNLNYLQSIHPGEAIFPVLKSNAYGHGLKEIATILRETNVPYLCVDSFPEYQIVRDYARKKSLILGETLPQNYLAYDPHRATPCVYNYETIKTLGQSGKKQNIHLFLNTGMNREGIQQQNLPKILELLEQYPNLILEGVMSHFANADEVDDSMDKIQIECFQQMLEIIRKSEIRNPKSYIHIANSAGTLKYSSSQLGCNARRCGLALYGYNPLPRTLTEQSNLSFPPGQGRCPEGRGFENHGQPTAHNGQLVPSLTLSSTIVSTQQLQTGDIVSYAGKRKAPHPGWSFTLPFGYFEGLPRNLTNKRGCDHEGLRHPQVGTICMNLSSYRSDQVEMKVGTKVTLISNNLESCILNLASLSGTIPYEILTRLHPSIRRRIVD